MCSLTYPLAEAAIDVADAEFALEQQLCEIDQPSQRRYALNFLKKRGDLRAVKVLLDFCPELQEKAEGPPLGIAAE